MDHCTVRGKAYYCFEIEKLYLPSILYFHFGSRKTESNHFSYLDCYFNNLFILSFLMLKMFFAGMHFGVFNNLSKEPEKDILRKINSSHYLGILNSVNCHALAM